MKSTEPPSHAAAEAQELHRVHKLNQALTEKGNATLGDLADLGLATIAGTLSDPRGWFSCPWCWRDYVRPGYRLLTHDPAQGRHA